MASEYRTHVLQTRDSGNIHLASVSLLFLFLSKCPMQWSRKYLVTGIFFFTHFNANISRIFYNSNDIIQYYLVITFI